MKNNRLIYIIIVFLVFWLALLSFSKKETVAGSKENINQYEVSGFATDFTKVVDENKESVVTIEADGVISSGFVYKYDNGDVHIVCSLHGVFKANSVNVIFDNSYRNTAQIIGYDQYADIAVLKVNLPYEVSPLKLADSSLLKQGEFVISIGTPTSLDYKGSIELGMISKNDLSLLNSITIDTKQNYYSQLVQISSNLLPGYSGSPILNMNGEVVGMNVMEDDDGHNFALTANEIKIIADNIINNTIVKKAQFGIKVSYVGKLKNYEKSALNIGIEQLNGLYVEKVLAGAMAYSMGIKQGDVVAAINNTAINDLDDFLSIAYSGATNYEFKIIRNNEEMLVTGTIDD